MRYNDHVLLIKKKNYHVLDFSLCLNKHLEDNYVKFHCQLPYHEIIVSRRYILEVNTRQR